MSTPKYISMNRNLVENTATLMRDWIKKIERSPQKDDEILLCGKTSIVTGLVLLAVRAVVEEQQKAIETQIGIKPEYFKEKSNETKTKPRRCERRGNH